MNIFYERFIRKIYDGVNTAGRRRGILTVLLCLMLCLALTSCGKQQAAETSASVSASRIEAAESETPEAEETQTGTSAESESDISETGEFSEPASAPVTKDGEYTSKEEVAAYIHEYGRLPSNFISKKEAESLGWQSSKGNLWDVAPGKSIGGSRFGNYEGNLPEAYGRKYYECDIGYDGGYRGAERIVFSSDGLVFYTDDHYKTFEQLY